MRNAVKSTLKGIGWIAIVGVLLLVILFAVVIDGMSQMGKERTKRREAGLTEQREEFREDMQTYFGLGESDYTIVSESYKRSGGDTYLVFTCGGEEKYYYSEGWTDYKTEEFCEEACAWFEDMIKKTEWFAGTETEIRKIEYGCKYLEHNENMLPLEYFKGTTESFLSGKCSDDGRLRDRLNRFYLTCEMQISASEVTDSAEELLQLKNTMPYLRQLIVHCYRVDPETEAKIFVRTFTLRYEQGEIEIYE